MDNYLFKIQHLPKLNNVESTFIQIQQCWINVNPNSNIFKMTTYWGFTVDLMCLRGEVGLKLLFIKTNCLKFQWWQYTSNVWITPPVLVTVHTLFLLTMESWELESAPTTTHQTLVNSVPIIFFPCFKALFLYGLALIFWPVCPFQRIFWLWIHSHKLLQVMLSQETPGCIWRKLHQPRRHQWPR